jgi:heme A synthase
LNPNKKGVEAARAVAGVAAVGTWLLIVLGGFVRVTESGMGCPDWPRCFGRWVPPSVTAAIIEVSHRYAAGVVALLVLAAVVVAFRARRDAPDLWRGVVLAAVLILVQIGLGAWTVATGNRGDTVVAHLVTALATLGALTWAWVRARAPETAGTDRGAEAAGSARSLGLWAWTLVIATLALAAVGGSVQVIEGGFACPEFPACGSWWPVQRGVAAQLHMVHRFMALGVGLVLAAVARASRRAGGRPWRWARWAVALYAVQALVGIAQVQLEMPSALRLAHLALGAGFWAVCVGLAGEAGWRAAAKAAA